MPTSTEKSVSQPSSWRDYLGFAFGLLAIAVVLIVAWMIYSVANTAIQAEENLHASLFTIRLVEQFVHENGRWPQSWNELEQMPFPGEAPSPLNGEITAIRIGGSRGYKWPDQSAHLSERISIDFDADVNSILNQHPMEFEAIKPKGSFFEYRDYGFVESLQTTLRQSASASGK